jgi:hypothetical protein
VVLRRRKQLLEQGLDHGPQSIVWTLQRDEIAVPSRSTVWRILTRHGLIVAQPHKRPKSATKRFCFSRPNECWQCDWTDWQRPPWMNSNALLAEFRDFYNHHRPHRALHGSTPAHAFIATEKARPAERPLPAPVFVSRHTVDEHSGKLHVAPYRINVGLRWAGHQCDVIRQGDHIAISSGTTLIRALTADPTRYYQPSAPNTRSYRAHEPKPPSSVSAMSRDTTAR